MQFPTIEVGFDKNLEVIIFNRQIMQEKMSIQPEMNELVSAAL